MPEAREVAIVTGAAQGIGRASAEALARSKRAVVIIDLQEEKAALVAAGINQSGGTAIAIAADVTDHQRAVAVVDEILARFGRVDALVNNAGRTMPKGLLEISEQEWDATIAVNLKSCFSWCQATVPAMLDGGGGRIVNISSLNAVTGGVTRAVSKSAYSAAKAGVLGLTRSLAKELAPRIAVNAILPGIIRTDINADMVDANKEMLVESILLGRLGNPVDIARWVNFLIAEPDMFVTGQSFVIDGGQWIT